MYKPLVTVVISVYNRAHSVGEAIDSVLNQSFRDFEIIVVDDGSTDATHVVLNTYSDRVRVIRQENGGVSTARNAGIKIAKGEWIAFLDSDDTWQTDKLKVQIDDLRESPTAVAHMVDARIVLSEDKQVSLFELRHMQEDFTRRSFRERPLRDVINTTFFTSTWMLNRKAMESAGYFDPSLKIFEDIDMLTRVAMEGPFVINLYVGTNIRRINASFPLSNLYQTERLQSIENLLHTYSRLKKDPRLAAEERQYVRRLIGGVQCEIATFHRKNRNFYPALNALLRSVAEEPGLRSVVRAILYAAGGSEFIDRVVPWRRSKGFRRSE